MKYVTLIAALCAASPVVAQNNCAPREIAVHNLAERYGESRRVLALSSDGLMVEMFANDDGQWTLLGTRADGMSCMFGNGSDFQLVTDPLPPLGDEG